MSCRFNIASSPPLGVVKWAGRYEINSHSFLDYLILCGLDDIPSNSELRNFLTVTDGVFYFNPYLPFGRAVLRLSPLQRFILIQVSWSQRSLFLQAVTLRRIMPLLKPKKRPLLDSPIPLINFIPPLYLPPPPPIFQDFFPQLLTLSMTPSPVHSPYSSGPSVGLPRQGIG